MEDGLLQKGRSRRVGIVLLTGIGDVVHGLALANDLKRDDPTREVVWVAEPAPAEVVRNHPAVDHVIAFRKNAGLEGVMELQDAFRGLPCDLTINLMRYGKGLPPALLSGAPVRLGLPRPMTRDGVHRFNTHSLPDQPWCHTQDMFLQMRGPLGLPEDGPVEWGIAFTEEERRDQREFFGELRGFADGRPVVGVVLGTANPAKDWPAHLSAQLCARLEDEVGAVPLLIGGPSEGERAAAEAVMDSTRATRNGLGNSVRRMMWMVDGVDLLVSTDTGPLHLAHALETPVVGLFGHTNPWRVGPWRRYHDLIIDHYTEPGAEPDPSGYDPRDGRMETITVDEVVAKVKQGLNAYPTVGHP